jgi:hypothetical protein
MPSARERHAHAPAPSAVPPRFAGNRPGTSRSRAYSADALCSPTGQLVYGRVADQGFAVTGSPVPIYQPRRTIHGVPRQPIQATFGNGPPRKLAPTGPRPGPPSLPARPSPTPPGGDGYLVRAPTIHAQLVWRQREHRRHRPQRRGLGPGR